MTKLLDRAVEAARSLSPAAQDDIARLILNFAGAEETAAVTLTPEEQSAIARSKAEAALGDFATDEQVRAAWAKYGV